MTPSRLESAAPWSQVKHSTRKSSEMSIIIIIGQSIYITDKFVLNVSTEILFPWLSDGKCDLV